MKHTRRCDDRGTIDALADWLEKVRPETLSERLADVKAGTLDENRH